VELSAFIEAAIGLVLIYLLFSLITTAIQEYVASIFNRRGKLLEEALISLLDGGRRGPIRGRLKSFFLPGSRINYYEGSLTKDILSHGSIWGLMRDDRLPSYLPANVFATTLLDILRARTGDKILSVEGIGEAVKLTVLSGTTRQALEAMISRSEGDIGKLQNDIESWYSDAMERVSGWYTREVRILLLILGLLVAGIFNVDTFHIANRLINDSGLRSRTLVAAQAIDSETLKQDASKLMKDITALKLPIGWPADQLYPLKYSNDGHTQVNENGQPIRETELKAFALVPMIAGWFVTAIALSFGASFWFDLLQNLLHLRSTGTKSSNGVETNGSSIKEIPKESSNSVENRSSANPVPYGSQNDFEKNRLTRFDIRDIQRALKIPDQQVSGILDEVTRTRIQAIQRQTGRIPDGLLTPDLAKYILTNNN